MIVDELNDKRNQKKAADGIRDFIEGVSSQSSAQSFHGWLLENMEHQRAHLAEGASSFYHGLVGTVVGHLFDTGVTPELAKEYLCRFVDYAWTQYQGIIGLPKK